MPAPPLEPSGPIAARPPAKPADPDRSGRLQRRLEAAWLERDGLGRWLAPLGLALGGLAALRRAGWESGLWQPVDVGLPVVVVGNLVAGGAGKTPVVLALVDALRAAGHRPGIVSRGYGARGRSGDAPLEVLPHLPARLTGDEPLLLRRRAACPVVVGSDRVAAARALRAAHPELSVIVSDDGLQHRRLGRCVEVVVFDERGAGNGRCLPAGPLREPMAAAPSQRMVVVYNADAPSTPWPGHSLRRGLSGVVSLQDWWQGRPASAEALQALQGRPLLAAAGTARPGRFFGLLREAGLDIQTLPLPDHHPFDTLPWPADGPPVVVTEKDAIKLDPATTTAPPVWVAPLDCRLDPASLGAVMARLSATPPC